MSRNLSHINHFTTSPFLSLDQKSFTVGNPLCVLAAAHPRLAAGGWSAVYTA